MAVFAHSTGGCFPEASPGGLDAVAREDFLGPGPWHIVRWGGGYRATPDADPIYLYTDEVIGIAPRAQPEQRPALASCGADCRRRAPARGACPAYRRRQSAIARQFSPSWSAPRGG